jgi:hypothetical protein
MRDHRGLFLPIPAKPVAILVRCNKALLSVSIDVNQWLISLTRIWNSPHSARSASSAVKWNAWV